MKYSCLDGNLICAIVFKVKRDIFGVTFLVDIEITFCWSGSDFLKSVLRFR